MYTFGLSLDRFSFRCIRVFSGWPCSICSLMRWGSLFSTGPSCCFLYRCPRLPLRGLNESIFEFILLFLSLTVRNRWEWPDPPWRLLGELRARATTGTFFSFMWWLSFLMRRPWFQDGKIFAVVSLCWQMGSWGFSWKVGRWYSWSWFESWWGEGLGLLLVRLSFRTFPFSSMTCLL